MGEIIKTFEFEAENVKLVLNINKELHRNCLRLIIDGDLITENIDIVREESHNFSSMDISLKFMNKAIIWISSNEYKGLRWDRYANETKYSNFKNIREMKEAYMIQFEFVTLISNYFYDCIKAYKNIELLYNTKIEDIVITGSKN